MQSFIHLHNIFSPLQYLSPQTITSEMTSNQMSHCCTVGSLHEGEAKGEIKDINNSTTFHFPWLTTCLRI